MGLLTLLRYSPSLFGTGQKWATTQNLPDPSWVSLMAMQMDVVELHIREVKSSTFSPFADLPLSQSQFISCQYQRAVASPPKQGILGGLDIQAIASPTQSKSQEVQCCKTRVLAIKFAWSLALEQSPLSQQRLGALWLLRLLLIAENSSLIALVLLKDILMTCEWDTSTIMTKKVSFTCQDNPL